MSIKRKEIKLKRVNSQYIKLKDSALTVLIVVLFIIYIDYFKMYLNEGALFIDRVEQNGSICKPKHR